MDLIKYQELAERTEKQLATRPAWLRHASLGLITELGEFATEVKRAVIYGKPLDADRVAHMGEELGDMCWYLAIVFNATGAAMDLPQSSWLASRGRNSQGGDELIHLDEATHQMAIQIGMLIQNQRSAGYHMRANAYTLVGLVNDACGLLGLRMLDILQDNINKLRERFPDAYSDYHAEARLDKGGVDARNS